LEKINKDKIFRLWSLIIHLKGKSRYKEDFPKLYFFYGSKRGVKKELIYGEYYNDDNIIKIWAGPHVNFNALASTMLHEYAHYLQFWPWYTRYRNTYSYETNPYEIEAKKFESLAPSLTKLVSDIAWKREIRKNTGISEIYERSIESIVIKS
jgi:hypothetical protein